MCLKMTARSTLQRGFLSFYRHPRVEQDLHRELPILRCIHVSSSVSKTSPKNLKGRKASSQQWLQRQLADPYVKRARFDSYRCRSAFKLLEIQEKHQLLGPGMTVIDCGAAPGSWSQVAVKHVNSLAQDKSALQGSVISVDLQYMAHLPGATILPDRDFTSAKCQREILQILRGQLADVIISDMAPNATGVKSLDHDIIVQLCLSVTDFSKVVLKDGGSLLCKLWQGQGQEQLLGRVAAMFGQVKIVKPQASRKDSAEVFVLAKDFKRDKENET